MDTLNDRVGKIPWEEVIFLAKDLSEDPEILKETESYFKKMQVSIFKDGVNVLSKMTEGFVIMIWLNKGGEMPEKYRKIYERRRSKK